MRPPRTLCFVLLIVLALLPGRAADARSGHVFHDRDGDGEQGPDEHGRGAVYVSDGERMAMTDPSGRWTLPDSAGGAGGAGDLVFVVRPSGFDAPVWYRSGDGGFGLVRRAAATPEGGFFFIHMSDAHVYDRDADFTAYSSPLPAFVPDFLGDWLTAWTLSSNYGEDRFRSSLEGALGGGPGVAALGDSALLRRWVEHRRSDPEGDRAADDARAAFREVGGLGPEFVVNTGDLILEGNRGDPEAIERWLRLYLELEQEIGAPVYATIGNNELAGTENDDFDADDPRYGRHFFHTFLGPSHYSFDRGPFHFVALDTHSAKPDGDGWRFGHMEPRVLRWLDLDLETHQDRVLVVLNHEPFHFDEAWGFDDDPDQRGDDEGRFARHGVDYVLSGHTHLGSYKSQDGIEHATAGALSGLRWVLPATLHPQGYRLVWAHDRRLFSAWKPLGGSVVTRADGPAGELVLAFAEADGPYAGIEASLAGTPVEVERWGRYFARVVLRAAPEAAGALDLVLERRDGGRENVRLEITP